MSLIDARVTGWRGREEARQLFVAGREESPVRGRGSCLLLEGEWKKTGGRRTNRTNRTQRTRRGLLQEGLRPAGTEAGCWVRSVWLGCSFVVVTPRSPPPFVMVTPRSPPSKKSGRRGRGAERSRIECKRRALQQEEDEAQWTNLEEEHRKK